MADVHHQSMELMSERMRKAMELPVRFAECRNPADIAKAQAEFASTMVSDYFEAGRKMLSLLNEATQNFAQQEAQAIGQQAQRPKLRGGH
jgi:hypothetical protein